MGLELALWVQYGNSQREGWEIKVTSCASKVTSEQSSLKDQQLDLDMLI